MERPPFCLHVADGSLIAEGTLITPLCSINITLPRNRSHLKRDRQTGIVLHWFRIS